MLNLSPQYLQHLNKGPFPNHIDPWAELGKYFQQIHGGIIGHLAEQISSHAGPLGYLVAHEGSIQVSELHKLDIWMQSLVSMPPSASKWSYDEAAEAILAEPGIEADNDDSLAALHIRSIQDGTLITVLEVVSPSNKKKPHEIEMYQEYRDELLHQGVNIVEIDATRSVKRLFEHRFTSIYLYHTVVHLPGERPRVIGTYFNQPLKRFALPLHEAVIPVEPQSAYNYAYGVVSMAGHINNNQDYQDETLPFPSLIPKKERSQLLTQVHEWQQRLTALRDETVSSTLQQDNS